MSTINPVAREDAEILRVIARGLSYNGAENEGRAKHKLFEIAMRMEAGFYGATQPCVQVHAFGPDTQGQLGL